MSRHSKPTMVCRTLVAAWLCLAGGSVWADDQESGDEGSSFDALDDQIQTGGDKKGEPELAVEVEAEPETDTGGLDGRLRFYSAAPGGEIGWLRVMEANGGPPMSIRLSLHGGFYTSSDFLNYSNATDYSQSNIAGRLGLAFSPLEYLEIFASLRNSSNKNSASQPSLLQTQGDLEFGLKGVFPVLPYLGLGLDLAVDFYNGIGEVTPDFGGTSVRTALLFTFDARGVNRDVPLRAHLNAGMIIENGDALQDGRELTWVEQYALRTNEFHRVFLGLSLDAPLPYLDPVGISPFLEYTVEIPVGVGEEAYAASSLGSDAALVDILPMRLTPGVRITYLQDITLDVAVDIGLGGEKAYLDGVPSTPPYTVWLGLTYAFDPTRRGAGAPAPAVLTGKVTSLADQVPIGGAVVSFAGSDTPAAGTDSASGRYRALHTKGGVIRATASCAGFKSDTREIAVETGETTQLDFILAPEPPPAPPVTTGRVVGRVINAADQMPIPGAIVSFEGGGITPVASDELEGKYATYDLTAGAVRLTASREGFKPLVQEAEVKVGETTLLDFALESDVRLGTLNGSVLDDKDKPLAAQVSLSGPVEMTLNSSADIGTFTSLLPAGNYTVKVTAEGYLAKGRQLELKEKETLSAEFKLSPKPKTTVVVLERDKKKISVKKKIFFESGSTNLRADAFQILDGVIDVLVNHPEIKRVRVEGHTDSVGSDTLNQRLSQGRAESVMAYLVQQGVAADKLEAVGYGEAKPIAPNNTLRGREQNRRVEFTILE